MIKEIEDEGIKYQLAHAIKNKNDRRGERVSKTKRKISKKSVISPSASVQKEQSNTNQTTEQD